MGAATAEIEKDHSRLSSLGVILSGHPTTRSAQERLYFAEPRDPITCTTSNTAVTPCRLRHCKQDYVEPSQRECWATSLPFSWLLDCSSVANAPGADVGSA